MGHPDQLPGRRRTDRFVSGSGELVGDGSRLEGFHVGAECRTGSRGGHRRDVVFERVSVDDHRWRWQVTDVHAAARYSRLRLQMT